MSVNLLLRWFVVSLIWPVFFAIGSRDAEVLTCDPKVSCSYRMRNLVRKGDGFLAIVGEEGRLQSGYFTKNDICVTLMVTITSDLQDDDVQVIVERGDSGRFVPIVCLSANRRVFVMDSPHAFL